MLLRENDFSGRWIDYEAVISGSLSFVPSGAAQDALAEDDASMLSIGMLIDGDEPFDTPMHHCSLIDDNANTPKAIQQAT